jgi:predicted permease
MDIFSSAFSETFLAILRIFFIVLAAGFLVRKKIITQSHIQGLTAATVNVFLPCLIFSNIVANFEPGSLKIWWVLPLAAVLLSALGLGLGAVLFYRELPAKKNMLALTSIQNAGYLILPIGAVVYADKFNTFALYCFLFILGISPILWRVGKYLCTSGAGENLSWKGLITPPFVANIIGLALVFAGLRPVFINPNNQTEYSLPHSLFQAVELLGEATVPLATFILGAVLGSIVFRLRPYWFDALRTVAVKLFILPLLTIWLLLYLDWGPTYPLLADFLVLQAASPPATGLILQVRNYGGDEQKISSLMLISYILCVVTLPFWLALWYTLK